MSAISDGVRGSVGTGAGATTAPEELERDAGGGAPEEARTPAALADALAGALRDPRRVAALGGAGILTGTPNPVFDRLTQLAAMVMRVPVALVSVVDVDRQVFVGCLGLPEPWASTRQTPLSHSFCQHVAATGSPLVVTDAREHPLVRDNLAIRDLGVVAYAGMPLLGAGGAVLGSFCVIDTRPRAWSGEDLAILRRLADSAETEIQLLAAERAASDAAARLEAAMEAADLGVWSYDAAAGQRWHSARASAMLGLGDGETQVPVEAWLARVHPDDRERVRTLLAAAVRGEARYAIEYRVVHADGTTRWIAASGRMTETPGAAGRLVGAVQDVTERVRLEQERREGAERLRRFVEALPLFAWLNRADGSVEVFNRRWYAYTGQDESYVADARWMEAVHADDRPRMRRERDRGIAAGQPYGVEFRARGADGGYRWVDARVEPVYAADGTLTAWVGAALDVDDRRRLEAALQESEARFRTLQDVSPDGSALFTAVRDARGEVVDFELTYANSAATRILTGSDEPLMGRSMRETFPESVAAGRFEIYRRVVDTGEPWQQDVAYTRGTVRRGLRVNAAKVGDGVHIDFADLTERFELAAERERLLAAERAARAEAEAARTVADAANRAKSDFLAMMSHELRTPLNAIGGYAELIEMGVRGPVTPEQRSDLQRVQKSQRHLLGLINGVLNYAKIDAGALEYEIADVPLEETVATCEALVAPQVRAKGLVFRHAGCAGVKVRADREKVQQIVLNLLSNAVKFTDKGGRIDVACAPAPDGATVRITVRDTGWGIPAAKLERVFEPFVQVDTELTRTQQGTGLGLAISRDLARGMGGDLTVASELGAGSTFTLSLPAA